MAMPKDEIQTEIGEAWRTYLTALEKSIALLEKDIQESLTYLLESEGYTVYTGSNGEEAKRIVREKKVNFAILDYYLSDLTGVQLAKDLHQIDESIRLMFFSGYSDVLNLKNDLGFTIYEVFLKPVDPDRFLEKLRIIVTKN